MDLRDRRDTYKGFSDGLTRAFELAVIPTLLGWVGYRLDRWIGIVPVLTIVFVVLAVVAVFTRLWVAYAEAMRQHDEASVWGRDGATAASMVDR